MVAVSIGGTVVSTHAIDNAEKQRTLKYFTLAAVHMHGKLRVADL